MIDFMENYSGDSSEYVDPDSEVSDSTVDSDNSTADSNANATLDSQDFLVWNDIKYLNELIYEKKLNK